MPGTRVFMLEFHLLIAFDDSGGRVGPRGSFHASARRCLLKNDAIKSIFCHLHAGPHVFHDWCSFCMTELCLLIPMVISASGVDSMLLLVGFCSRIMLSNRFFNIYMPDSIFSMTGAIFLHAGFVFAGSAGHVGPRG